MPTLHGCGCVTDEEFCPLHNSKWIIQSFSDIIDRKVKRYKHPTMRIVYGPQRALPKAKGCDLVVLQGKSRIKTPDVPHFIYGTRSQVDAAIASLRGRKVTHYASTRFKGARCRTYFATTGYKCDRCFVPADLAQFILSCKFKNILHLGIRTMQLASMCHVNELKYTANTTDPLLSSVLRDDFAIALFIEGQEKPLCLKN